MRKEYKVIVDHPLAPELHGQHTFRCSQDGEYGWYADAPRFGCSKTYATPEQAIGQMVVDHGGSVLSMERTR